MATLVEFAGKQLLWAQVKGEKKLYDLRSGDAVLGKLSLSKEAVTGELDGQRWVFSREGFFRPRLTVRTADSDKPMATLEVGALASGRLIIDGNDAYRWAQQGMFSNQWAFVTGDKKVAINFKLDSGLLSTSAEVSFDEEQAAKPEAALLAVLGWYVLLLYAEDAAPAGI